ncbi:RNA-directed DNA polymerase, eukaryota [Tanacetum coccineum]
MNLPSTLLPSIDLGYIEDKYSGLSSQAFLHIWSSLRCNKGISFHEPEDAKIWIPTNPRRAERLPPYKVTPESDLYLRRLYGKPSELKQDEMFRKNVACIYVFGRTTCGTLGDGQSQCKIDKTRSISETGLLRDFAMDGWSKDMLVRILGIMVGILLYDQVESANLVGQPLGIMGLQRFIKSLGGSVGKQLFSGYDISFRRNASVVVSESKTLLADFGLLDGFGDFIEFGCQTRWIKHPLLRVNIFRLAGARKQDCLPTRVNLIRRGITIESSLCPVCSVCEEDVCHIFFRCDLAQLVLRRICRWWGLDPMTRSSFQSGY